MKHRFLTGAAAIALAWGLAATAPARADDAAPPPHPMVGPFMFSGHIDGGVAVNFDDPANHVNFGHAFTDSANSPRMNQLMAAVEKDLDPAATGLDWGFKAQLMYGTDSRFPHAFGFWDLETHSPYQFDVAELSASAHLPIIWSGGIDLKGGVYPTPIGYEYTDSSLNFFYTHSYIFNFGIPLKHTGLYTVSHATSFLDLWLGVDTGNQGFVWSKAGDNNNSGAILGGFAINNPIPNLTILALAHYGPQIGYDKNTSFNYFNGAGVRQDVNRHALAIFDVTTTYKLNDQITLANEIVFDKDDLGVTNCGSPLLCHSGATAEGAAFYGIYTLNDQMSFGARWEIFRDDQGFFVGAFPGGEDFLRVERAKPAVPPGSNSAYFVGKATYMGLTVGMNYKPPLPALPLNAGLTIRPELRWDHAWGLANTIGNKAFNKNAAGNNTTNDQFLFSIDAIFGF